VNENLGELLHCIPRMGSRQWQLPVDWPQRPRGKVPHRAIPVLGKTLDYADGTRSRDIEAQIADLMDLWVGRQNGTT
jgi:hypothetical protein